MRELDRAQTVRTHDGADVRLPDGRKSKADALAEADIPKSTAYDYQELAGPRDEQAQKAGKAAAEKYFAEARATKVPATMDGLRGAVRGAVHATVGAPPERQKPRPAIEPTVEAIGNDWVDWNAAVRKLAELEIDPEELAGRLPALNATHLEAARIALPKLEAWVKSLERACEAKRPAA